MEWDPEGARFVIIHYQEPVAMGKRPLDLYQVRLEKDGKQLVNSLVKLKNLDQAEGFVHWLNDGRLPVVHLEAY